eukprot:5350471-Amphidinium_carterae.2
MFFLSECGVDMNSDLVLSHKAVETRKKHDGGNFRCLPEFAVSVRLLLAYAGTLSTFACGFCGGVFDED